MSYRVPTFLVAAALIAGGCGSDNSSTDKPATSGSAATQQANAAKAPYGLYVRTVTKQDIARTAAHRDEHGPNQSTPTTGKYRLAIAKGALAVTEGPRRAVLHRYVMDMPEPSP